jgi:hypothetical protein
MMRRSSLAWTAVLIALAGRAAADDLDELMHSLSQRSHAQTSFVELKYLSLLKKPVESKGHLVYDAPDRLQKRTTEPRAEDLVLNGTELTIVRGGRRHVLDLKSYPQVLPFVEGIRATLAGDRSALERTFKMQFSGALAHWTLVLVPLDAAVARAVAQVQIEGEREDLLQVEVRQPDGDRSVMRLERTPAP